MAFPSDLEKLGEICRQDFRLAGLAKTPEADDLCNKIHQLKNCQSTQGIPIYHYNRGGSSLKGKRILAMSLIHGDEVPSGGVTRAWMSRLEKIDPRNAWRVIPVANPDGLRTKQRTNSKGVDLNRNFPTKEWATSALQLWRSSTHSDPRRYPGPNAASEVETKCLLNHIEDFQPDFIISIHTPIGVLDFDGPPVKVPRPSPLPWNSLGNYPGSLGRYMWKDRNVPVLTIELKGNSGAEKLEEFDRLQDISGALAIESKEKFSKESPN
jgi:murein peptide amidase A